MSIETILFQLAFLVLFSGSFVYSSAVENVQQSCRINDLDDFLLLVVGEYLECPQRKVAFLDKYWYNLFVKEHPYRKLLKERHEIRELVHSTSDKDLGVFEQMAFIRDTEHLYNSVGTHLFTKKSFSENQHLIFRYLTRIQDELGYLELNNNVIENDERIKILLQDPDMDYIIEYVVKNKNYFKWFCDGLDMTVGKGFMQRIFNIDEALYRRIERYLEVEETMVEFDRNTAAFNVHRRLSRLFASSSKYHGKILFMYIIAGVPDSWYIPWAVNHLGAEERRACFKMILCRNRYVGSDVGSEEDKKRIHRAMDRLLSSTQDIDRNVRIFKLLNNILYGPSVENYQEIFSEIEALQLDSELMRAVIAVSTISKNYNLLREIKKAFPRDTCIQAINVFYMDYTDNYEIHVLFWFLGICSAEEKEKMFTDQLFIVSLIYKYFDIEYCAYNYETRKVTFYMILIPDSSVDSSLPSSFEFHLKLEAFLSNERGSRSIKNSFFYQHSERTEESLARLLESYNQMRSLASKRFSDTPYATSPFLKVVAKSEMLTNMVKAMNLNFWPTDDDDVGSLLELDAHFIPNLGDILGYASFPVREPLFQAKNFKQVKNLEKLLELDIAEIMLNRGVIPPEFAVPVSSFQIDDTSRKIEFCQKHYFELSTALRYWLKSPQRHRMSELKAKYSMLLILLQKEVDMEDAAFLKSL